MATFLTVALRGGEEVVKKFDGGDAPAIAWLRDEFLPKHMERVLQIHVDRSL